MWIKRAAAVGAVSGLALLVVVGTAGCALVPDAVAVSRAAGWSGWFSVDVGEVPTRSYDDRLTQLPLGLNAPPCGEVRAHLRPATVGRPVVVLVHGMGGDSGEAWQRMVPRLARLRPAAVFLYRWVPYGQRDALVEGLAAGVTRLLDCTVGHSQQIIIISHSAGGVLASLAASRIALPASRSHSRIFILTVATPLAGVYDRVAHADGTPQVGFFLDLSTASASYPEPAVGVSVIHLHTSYPTDPFMKPSASGHRPNARDVGVPGSLHIDLPARLEHSEAIVYVVDALAHDSLGINGLIGLEAAADTTRPAPEPSGPGETPCGSPTRLDETQGSPR